MRKVPKFHPSRVVHDRADKKQSSRGKGRMEVGKDFGFDSHKQTKDLFL